MITINVTQEHIDQGEEGSCDKCPVALALLEQVPDIREVAVTEESIDLWIGENANFLNIKTPDSVALFIDMFDNLDPIKPKLEPFSFELNL